MSDLIERYRAAPSGMLAVEVADEMVEEIQRLTAELADCKESRRLIEAVDNCQTTVEKLGERIHKRDLKIERLKRRVKKLELESANMHWDIEFK